MKIRFCDLCNESVPESDLESGKAVVRKDRVVCATCESLMSAAGTGAAPGAPPAARAGGPGEPAAVAPASKGGSGGGWIGLLALAIACGGGWLLYGEVTAQREELAFLRTDLGGKLEQSALDLDEVSRRSRTRSVALETRLDEALEGRLQRVEAELAALRLDLEAAAEERGTLRVGLESLAADVRRGDEEFGERIDELMARSIKSREEVDQLRDRLRQAETAVAGSAPSSPPPVLTPAAPPWVSELAGLADENAGKRWNAVQALGDTGDPAVIPHLVPLISDPDVFVRMAVARVLGDLGSPEAVETLIGALEDEEAVVREAAMVSLHAITGRNFRFDPMAGPADRAKKVKAWRQWWEKAKDEYLGRA